MIGQIGFRTVVGSEDEDRVVADLEAIDFIEQAAGVGVDLGQNIGIFAILCFVLNSGDGVRGMCACV